MKKNIIIAVTVLVSLGLLLWGIEFLKGVNLFKPANYYYARFNNVDGLVEAAPVTINGFQVGQVREISYDYGDNSISVLLSMNTNLKIPEGSIIYFKSSIMGSSSLELSLATGSNAYLKAGDDIKSVDDVGLMGMLTNDMMPQVNGMLPKVDSILGNVNSLVEDPALTASVARLDAITAELAKSAKQLTILMNSLNKSVPGVMGNVNGITSNLTTTTDNLNALSEDLRKMPLDSTVSNLNGTIANLQMLTGELNNKLNDKNSSLGLLLNDNSLYYNADHAVSSLDSLFIDVKKNPKRYINLKIF